jgi:hypothetical protein
MNATILNYPGFQTLPKGAKQMLVASETYFFDQPASYREEQKGVTNATFAPWFIPEPRRLRDQLSGNKRPVDPIRMPVALNMQPRFAH